MMAGRKGGYRFFAQSNLSVAEMGKPSVDEFDEADIWGCPVEPRAAAPEPIRAKAIPSSRSGRKKADHAAGAAPGSLPVNIPDWSKILKEEYVNSYGGGRGAGDWEEEEDEEGGTGVVIPPHVLAWRNRGASFSVQEGAGRTLKGRDLRRVRNAIFEKIGFQD